MSQDLQALSDADRHGVHAVSNRIMLGAAGLGIQELTLRTAGAHLLFEEAGRKPQNLYEFLGRMDALERPKPMAPTLITARLLQMAGLDKSQTRVGQLRVTVKGQAYTILVRFEIQDEGERLHLRFVKN